MVDEVAMLIVVTPLMKDGLSVAITAMEEGKEEGGRDYISRHVVEAEILTILLDFLCDSYLYIFIA